MSQDLLESEVLRLKELDRVADLTKFKDQLFTEDLRERFYCLHYLPKKTKYCSTDCQEYPDNHKALFEAASRKLVLDADKATKRDFIAVLRTLFCRTHDPNQPSTKFKAYRIHFERLWEAASADLKGQVWEALRNSGRGIYPPKTPQRPQNKHTNSAPPQIPQINVKMPDDSPSSAPGPALDAPSRPRTAQAKLGRNDGLFPNNIPIFTFADASASEHDTECDSNPNIHPRLFRTVSPQPTRRTLSPRLAKHPFASAENASEGIYELPTSEIPHSSVGKAKGGVQAPQAARDSSVHDLLDFSEWIRRDVGNSSTKDTWTGPSGQTNAKSIFEMLATGERGSPSPSNTGLAAKDSTQLDSAVQREQTSGQPMANTRFNAHEHEFHREVFEFRFKPPAVHENRNGFAASPQSPLPASSDHLKNFRATVESEDEDIEARSLPSSQFLNSTPPYRKSAPATQRQASVLPRPKTAKKPCAYDLQRPWNIATNIRELLLKDIAPKTGAIYVLEAPDFFETYEPALSRNEKWVKIGISSNIQKRINSIKNQCCITGLEAIYSSDLGNKRMDHLHRIEKVCHAALNNYRRRMDCKNEGVLGARCRDVHEEWFAVDTEVAIRTVKKWRKLLDHELYDQYGTLDNFWKGRLANRTYKSPNVGEESKHHESAHEILDKWLEESIKEWNEIYG